MIGPMDSADEGASSAGQRVGSGSDVVEPRQERSIESTDRLIEAATELFADRATYGRAALLMGARSPETLLYREELETWRARLDIEVEVTVDSAEPSWRGDVGVVTTLIDRAPIDPANARVFVCGPEVMMRFCARALEERGVPADEIFVSLERNMHCAVGHCGHCQLGSEFVCKDGPVFPWTTAEPLLRIKER